MMRVVRAFLDELCEKLCEREKGYERKVNMKCDETTVQHTKERTEPGDLIWDSEWCISQGNKAWSRRFVNSILFSRFIFAFFLLLPLMRLLHRYRNGFVLL